MNLLKCCYYQMIIRFGTKNCKKTRKMAKQAYFDIVGKKQKYSPLVVFGEESETSLEFEINQQQRKIWHKPNLQLIVNPAVQTTLNIIQHNIEDMNT